MCGDGQVLFIHLVKNYKEFVFEADDTSYEIKYVVYHALISDGLFYDFAEIAYFDAAVRRKNMIMKNMTNFSPAAPARAGNSVDVAGSKPRNRTFGPRFHP